MCIRGDIESTAFRRHIYIHVSQLEYVHLRGLANAQIATEMT